MIKLLLIQLVRLENGSKKDLIPIGISLDRLKHMVAVGRKMEMLAPLLGLAAVKDAMFVLGS